MRRHNGELIHMAWPDGPVTGISWGTVISVTTYASFGWIAYERFRCLLLRSLDQRTWIASPSFLRVLPLCRVNGGLRLSFVVPLKKYKKRSLQLMVTSQ